MSKTDLKARPIFHHTRDAIEAHLTIVFTALAIARHLQNTTAMSIRKIVQTLRPLQQITFAIAGHEHTAADPSPTPPAKSSPQPGPSDQHTRPARLETDANVPPWSRDEPGVDRAAVPSVRLARLDGADAVGPHHLVVLVLDDVAVPDELAGCGESHTHPGHLARQGRNGVLDAGLP